MFPGGTYGSTLGANLIFSSVSFTDADACLGRPEGQSPAQERAAAGGRGLELYLRTRTVGHDARCKVDRTGAAA